MVDFTALPGSLDLYELMVNYIAGGILMSLFIWGAIIFITGIMGRLSIDSLFIILITYFVAASIGYFGSLYSLLLYIVAIWYAVSGILKYFNNGV